MNHELSPRFLKDVFQDFDSISTESVFVKDNNFLDHSCESFVQNGLQTFSFEVESGSDVTDDDVFWIMSCEILDLSLQIFFLMWTTDSAINDLLRFLSMVMGLGT